MSSCSEMRCPTGGERLTPGEVHCNLEWTAGTQWLHTRATLRSGRTCMLLPADPLQVLKSRKHLTSLRAIRRTKHARVMQLVNYARCTAITRSEARSVGKA